MAAFEAAVGVLSVLLEVEFSKFKFIYFSFIYLEGRMTWRGEELRNRN